MEFTTIPVDASSSRSRFFVPSVGNLPAELLIETFAFCAAADPLAPLTLGAVCRFWKKVVDESPRIWQVVILDDKRSLAASQSQARLWISRSAPLQLDVKLHIEDADNVLFLLAPFLPVFHRWRQLTITGAQEESICLSDTFSRLDMLNDLSISVGDDKHADVVGRSTFVQYSPLWPNRIAMNIWLTKLPQRELMTALRFTSLSITEQSPHSTRPDSTAVLVMLKSCPLLESFTLSGWMDADVHGSHLPPVVSLPRLHTMHLRRTTLARAILSHVNAPVLRTLYLANLNIGHRISPESFEPGDSEDEAHDYSQSPWTDQATGMGLRNLIARCNPPIKSLEMDYSDMRTKDFIYVFEHLTELEDFLIVASDMSNTVIRLLKPYDEAALAAQSNAALTSEENDDPCLSPAPSLTVRLPHLRNLELYNCHRISGDTIVETLMQRFKYTDRFTPENTMEELIISECEQFRFQHQDMLAKEMGPRFKSD
ncbi:hypothetical protein J3R30DRAFT_3699562 [Lentinula aciculospora]|uniref:F-box domain-containing protein n=1 Tax=Lentinula aciculospora TaxID=153920 RepID=A0A9W9DSG4_9AGAR|nr:hypothetical protein J3R30DRAFT_3699562 [Lentinula aciculospora]